MSSIYGFFMAWGMFCGIPCPVKIWKEEYRKHMLIMLPVLGLMLGAIWYAALALMSAVHLPVFLTGAAACVIPFFLTGSIHTDGYMDVCDAVFSRRDVEEKRRILKDSANGSFAMIGLVVYAVLFFGAAASAAGSDPLRLLAWMIPVPMASRLPAVIYVVSKPVLPGSQYRDRSGLRDGGTVVRMIWQTVVIFVICEVLIFVICGGGAQLSQLLMAVPPAAACVFSALSGRTFVKDLGGMSGDISGAMITIGDLAGMIACAVLA